MGVPLLVVPGISPWLVDMSDLMKSDLLLSWCNCDSRTMKSNPIRNCNAVNACSFQQQLLAFLQQVPAVLLQTYF